MNLRHRPTITVERPGARNGSEVHLQGVWLVMARVVWVVIALFATGLLVASLPSYFAYLHMTNTTSIYGPQLAPGDVRELHVLGLSLDFYAWLNIGVFLVFWLICISIGVMLFLRRPDDRLALLASLILVLFPIEFNTQIIFPNEPLNNTWLFVIPLAGLAASMIALQVYRYRRVSTSLQRQQTKWVVFGIAVTFGGFVASLPLVDGLLPQFFPMGPLAYFLAQMPFTLLLLLFPLSIAFAILHNRLWEIDRLISRSLVYGTLTITLGLIYAGLIIGLQALLGTIIKQNNDVAIVVSTLAIYVLFQPLRRGIQSIIDRRFYRRKYDAARTLAAFSATLRHEVDLASLSEHLVAVVQETMQPTSVSLWLRPPTPAGTHQAPWRATPAGHSKEEARGEER